MDIDGNKVFEKLRELYPTELSHAVAEVRADALQERINELEATQ